MGRGFTLIGNMFYIGRIRVGLVLYGFFLHGARYILFFFTVCIGTIVVLVYNGSSCKLWKLDCLAIVGRFINGYGHTGLGSTNNFGGGPRARVHLFTTEYGVMSFAYLVGSCSGCLYRRIPPGFPTSCDWPRRGTCSTSRCVLCV